MIFGAQELETRVSLAENAFFLKKQTFKNFCRNGIRFFILMLFGLFIKFYKDELISIPFIGYLLNRLTHRLSFEPTTV